MPLLDIQNGKATVQVNMQPRDLSASFAAEAHEEATSKNDKEGCWVPVKLVVATKAAVDNALTLLDTHMNRLGMLDEDFREQEIYQAAREEPGPPVPNGNLESEDPELEVLIETPESGVSLPTCLNGEFSPNSITSENLPNKIKELEVEINKRDKEKREEGMPAQASHASSSAGSGKAKRLADASAKAKARASAKAKAKARAKAKAKARAQAKAKARAQAKAKARAKAKAAAEPGAKAKSRAMEKMEWSPISLGKKIRSVLWLKYF